MRLPDVCLKLSWILDREFSDGLDIAEDQLPLLLNSSSEESTSSTVFSEPGGSMTVKTIDVNSLFLDLQLIIPADDIAHDLNPTRSLLSVPTGDDDLFPKEGFLDWLNLEENDPSDRFASNCRPAKPRWTDVGKQHVMDKNVVNNLTSSRSRWCRI
jgi:hypothetical protein